MSTLSKPRTDLRQLLRFGSVGLANTVLGYTVILIGLALGWGDIFSNLAGYATGLSFGFFLNKSWTFNSTAQSSRTTGLKYLAGFLFAYSANLGVIAIARTSGFLDNPLTHLAGICLYSILFYLICSSYVFAPSKPAPSEPSNVLDQWSLASKWPELSVLLGWFSVFFFVPYISISHDVVWQMWIARQILGGAGLYRDILEVNPPLWFWLATPVQWVAQTFAISSGRLIVAAVLMLAGGSLAILSAILADQPVKTRASILWAAFVAIILLPLQDFAQREHLCLIGAVPYLALMARRADHREIPWSIALVVGLIAAPGFALKHTFILVPLFLEVWLIFRLRRKWTPVRPEVIALFVVALCYALSVIAFTPDYLTTVIPMLRTAYGGYGSPFIGLAAQSWVAMWVLSLLVLLRYRENASSLTISAIIVAAAFCISYFAQQKGWGYHALPATGALFFATATLWSGETKTHVKGANFILAGALALFLLPSIKSGPYTNAHASNVNNLLRIGKPGMTAVMLTGHPSHIWPMVEQQGFKWPSRHLAFWMTHAIAAQEKSYGSLSQDLSNLADSVRKQTVEDFRCNPPDIILVDDFSNSNSPGFDILGFFEQDDDFKQLFSHYAKINTVDGYTAYTKQADLNHAPSGVCRTIH